MPYFGNVNEMEKFLNKCGINIVFTFDGSDVYRIMSPIYNDAIGCTISREEVLFEEPDVYFEECYGRKNCPIYRMDEWDCKWFDVDGNEINRG